MSTDNAPDSAVSPVVGVILLVAVTVVLSAVLFGVVSSMNLQGADSANSAVKVSTSVENGTESLTLTVVSSEEPVYYRIGSGNKSRIGTVGDSVTLVKGVDYSVGDAIIVLTNSSVVQTVDTGGSSSGATVLSVHTDAVDFKNAVTLSNVNVTGSGQSASIVQDEIYSTGFESGSISWFSTEELDTPSSGTNGLTSSTVWSGSYSYYMNDTDSSNGYGSCLKRTGSVSDDWKASFMDYQGVSSYKHHTTFVEFWENDSGSYSIGYGNPTGNDKPRLTLKNRSRSVLASKSVEPPTNEWYEIEVVVSNGSLTVTSYYKNGTKLHELSYTFSELQSGGLSVCHYSGAGQTMTAYSDSITITNPTLNSTYTSQNHSVTNGTSGWVDVQLDNATASITWEVYNTSTSSWDSLGSVTATSSGTHSVDFGKSVSGDVRVVVSPTASSSKRTITVEDEGVMK